MSKLADLVLDATYPVYVLGLIFDNLDINTQITSIKYHNNQIWIRLKNDQYIENFTTYTLPQIMFSISVHSNGRYIVTNVKEPMAIIGVQSHPPTGVSSSQGGLNIILPNNVPNNWADSVIATNISKVRTDLPNSFPNGNSFHQPCSHDWKHYQGFTEAYDYCVKCGDKK